MTCIVGIEHEGRVLIGGDSAGVGGYSITSRGDSKVFNNSGLVFGFTSSFRMGQLLRYKFNPPEPDERDLDRYMATLFVDEVRTVLKDGGYASVRNNEETGGTFLVGVQGTLYSIDSDFQIGRSREGYQAVGCGEDIALGSLYTSREFDLTPRQRARMALQAAAKFSAAVAGPFNFVEA